MIDKAKEGPAQSSSAGKSKKAAQLQDQKVKKGVTAAVCKCLRCGQLSGGCRWFKNSRVWDKKADEFVDMPEEDKCKQCGDLHVSGFGHMSWSEFCEQDKDADMKKCSAEAEQSLSSGEVKFTSEVMRSDDLFMEVETSAILLTERDLMRKLGARTLPKHMKRIPTIKIPVIRPDKKEVALGKRKFETCYAFKDEQNPYRRARLVQRVRVSEHSTLLKDPKWSRQAASVALQKAEAEMEDTNSKQLVEKRGKLLSLDAYVKSKTRGNVSAVSHAAAQQGKESDDEAESSSQQQESGEEGDQDDDDGSESGQVDDETSEDTGGESSDDKDKEDGKSVMTTPKKKKADAQSRASKHADATPPPKLERSKSGMLTIGGSPSGNDAMSVAETLKAETVNEDSHLKGDCIDRVCILYSSIL